MTPVIAFGEALVDMLSAMTLAKKPSRLTRAARLLTSRLPVPDLMYPASF